jgi:hypothetical protein
MPSTAISQASPNIYIDGTTYAAPTVDMSVERTSAIWPVSNIRVFNHSNPCS